MFVKNTKPNCRMMVKYSETMAEVLHIPSVLQQLTKSSRNLAFTMLLDIIEAVQRKEGALHRAQTMPDIFISDFDEDFSCSQDSFSHLSKENSCMSCVSLQDSSDTSRLVGCPPFWHRKQMMMLRSIMEGKYSLTTPEWNDISDQCKDLISKLLVVDASKRLTAKEAMEHPFFKREEFEKEEKKKFFPKRKFKAYGFTIIAMNRLRTLHLNPPSVSLEQVRRDPYSVKGHRKEIDAIAFRVYGHWVKRGENQNRAALFENAPKRDLKLSERYTSTEQLNQKSKKA